MCSIEHLQETFNQLPYITVHEGPHDYPVVFIQHPNGADITLHLHGGFISSWVDVDQELLFIHPGTDFKPSRSLTCAPLSSLRRLADQNQFAMQNVRLFVSRGPSG